MCKGREVSQSNINNLKSNLTRLYTKQVRVSDQIKELSSLIEEYETKCCWSCRKSNDTTTLALCEVGNPLYPLACDEFK